MKVHDFIDDIKDYLLHGVVDEIIDDIYIGRNKEHSVIRHGLSSQEFDRIKLLVEEEVLKTPSVGQYINECLYKVQMSQQQLADKSGFSKAYVSNVINGRNNPPKYKLVRMAIAMNLSTEETAGLLATVGYSFNKSIKDRIIVACIELGIQDLIKVEEALNRVANANETLYS